VKVRSLCDVKTGKWTRYNPILWKATVSLLPYSTPLLLLLHFAGNDRNRHSQKGKSSARAHGQVVNTVERRVRTFTGTDGRPNDYGPPFLIGRRSPHGTIAMAVLHAPQCSRPSTKPVYSAGAMIMFLFPRRRITRPERYRRDWQPYGRRERERERERGSLGLLRNSRRPLRQ